MKEREFRPDSRAICFYRTAQLLLASTLVSFATYAQAADPMHLARRDAKRPVKVTYSI